MPAWLRNTMVAASGAMLAGSIELRVSVARLESHLEDVLRRLDRIEQMQEKKYAESD